MKADKITLYDYVKELVEVYKYNYDEIICEFADYVDNNFYINDDNDDDR